LAYFVGILALTAVYMFIVQKTYPPPLPKMILPSLTNVLYSKYLLHTHLFGLNFYCFGIYFTPLNFNFPYLLFLSYFPFFVSSPICDRHKFHN
jgi:hypothetical protein